MEGMERSREVRIGAMDGAQTAHIEESLSQYDAKHMGKGLSGGVRLGLFDGETLIGGGDGTMTAFRIFYLSTLYVEEAYRGRGLGAKLLVAIEERARALGANLIRLDTFDFQGMGFYERQGYTRVGGYACTEDGFSESFFLKRLEEPS